MGYRLRAASVSREVEEREERPRKKNKKKEGGREGKGKGKRRRGREGEGRGGGRDRRKGKEGKGEEEEVEEEEEEEEYIVRAEERPAASRRARPNRQAEIQKHEQAGHATQRLSSFACAFSQTTVSCLAAMTFSGFDGASYVMVGCGSPGTSWNTTSCCVRSVAVRKVFRLSENSSLPKCRRKKR